MAEAYYTIPLKPEPQSFGITLAGKEYRLTVRWLDVGGVSPPRPEGATGGTAPHYEGDAPEAGWTLDIEEPDKAAPIVMGIPLVTGCDLLEQYAYLEFGGELWVEGELPPGLENLGSSVELVFVVEE